MEELVFVEKDIIPNNKLIKSTLNESFTLYLEILRKLETMVPSIQTEWKYYGKKNGWLLKHLDAKRNLFFLVIYDSSFKLSFTFKDETVAKILSSDNVNAGLKKLIENSKKYIEGTTILYTVKSENDIDEVIDLIKYKLKG